MIQYLHSAEYRRVTGGGNPTDGERGGLTGTRTEWGLCARSALLCTVMNPGLKT